MVGFALETENVLSHAQAKLEHKNMDIIVINSPRDEGAAFGKDTNKISLLHANRKLKSFELKSKADVAKDILEEIFISYKKK
jgi:phosphopantothenoylcysteine decarboxylase/phosphopantothenate--cysteine ligase